MFKVTINLREYTLTEKELFRAIVNNKGSYIEIKDYIPE